LSRCFFVSDLHGKADRYRKLFDRIAAERPAAVFLGGDLLPHVPSAKLSGAGAQDAFIEQHLAAGFRKLQDALGNDYPKVFLILGNDDPRAVEPSLVSASSRRLWEYMHDRRAPWRDYAVYGYACVPPTPFQLKDWEKYDVSQFVDPGSISPESGFRTVPVPAGEIRFATIQADLDRLAGDDDLTHAVFLLHTPPHQTALDRAALDGVTVDRVPLDVHVGSIAVRRFIEKRQPLITLHGHIHESARITGSWRERIGRTHAFSAAHDGPELALVRFSPDDPSGAARELI